MRDELIKVKGDYERLKVELTIKNDQQVQALQLQLNQQAFSQNKGSLQGMQNQLNKVEVESVSETDEEEEEEEEGE